MIKNNIWNLLLLIFLMVILRINHVGAGLELGRLDKIIFNSSFPNSPSKELVISPCSFTIKNPSNITDIYVVIGTPPASHFANLRKRMTYNLLSRNGVGKRSFTDFPITDIDTQLEIPLTEFCSTNFWRITPNTIEIFNRIQKGIPSNNIQSTMNLNLIHKNSDDAPLYFDVTLQFDLPKLVPLAGAYGSSYHFNQAASVFKSTKCPVGTWVRYISVSSISVTNGTGSITAIYMTNFNALCTDETSLAVSNQVKFTDSEEIFVLSAKPFITECNAQTSLPVAGFQIGVDNSVGNARFLCSNNLDTPWIFKSFIPDDLRTQTFMCPNGYLANGFISYSSFIIHGLGLTCEEVPLTYNVTALNAITLSDIDTFITLSSSMINVTIDLGSRRDIMISLTQKSNFPQVQVVKQERAELKLVSEFTFGDVLDGVIRIKFPAGYFQNGDRLHFNLNIRSNIRHKVDNLDFTFTIAFLDSKYASNIGVVIAFVVISCSLILSVSLIAFKRSVRRKIIKRSAGQAIPHGIPRNARKSEYINEDSIQYVGPVQSIKQGPIVTANDIFLNNILDKRNNSQSYIADSVTVRQDKSITGDHSRYKDNTDRSLDPSITREYNDKDRSSSNGSSSYNFREKVSGLSSSIKKGALNFLSTRPLAMVSKKLVIDKDLVMEGVGDGRFRSIRFLNYSLIQKFGKVGRVEFDPFSDEENFKLEIAVLGVIPQSNSLAPFFGWIDAPNGTISKVFTLTLREFLHRPEDIDFSTLRGFLKDIANGLANLQSFRIVHFNLSPYYMYVREDEEQGQKGKLRCVVGGFKFARMVGWDMPNLPDSEKHPDKPFLSNRYRSPEVIAHSREPRVEVTEKKKVQEIHKKADIYAMSIVFMEIVTRKLAWPLISDEGELAEIKLAAKDETTCDFEQRDLFKSILGCRGTESAAKFVAFVENGVQKDPEIRPSLGDLTLP